jgi:hypothetical protein
MTIQSTQVFESNGVNVGEKNWTIGEEWHNRLHHALGFQTPK